MSAADKPLPRSLEEAYDDILEFREEISALQRVVEPSRRWAQLKRAALSGPVPPPRSVEVAVEQQLLQAIESHELALAKKMNGGR